MSLSSIASFEKRKNVSINVYQLENGKLVAVFYSKNKSSKRRVNLLRLVSGCKTHYCVIKNSNLLQRLTRSEKKRKHGSKCKFCSNCFQPIIKRNYRRHTNFCESNAALEVRMPVSSPNVEFQNWQKTQRVPFVVYADLEAIDVRSVDASKLGSNTKEIERQSMPFRCHPRARKMLVFTLLSNNKVFHLPNNCLTICLSAASR